MALNDYPIKFDGEAIFMPDSWSEDSGTVESVNETEAGTDQVIVTRYDKLTASASFSCTSRWAKKFKAYSKKDSIAVSLYDFETEGYKVRQMRIRDFKASLVDNSARTPGTMGLWKISFSLVEF